MRASLAGLVIAGLARAHAQSAPLTMQQIADRMLTNYSRITNPTLALAEQEGTDDNVNGICHEVQPTMVDAQIYVTKLASIDQKTGTFELEGFFRLWWNDARLQYAGPEDGGCVKKMVFLDGPAKLWVPDFYFPLSGKQSVGAKYDGQQMDVYSNGDVYWSNRLRMTGNCKMNFQQMPWDEQRCGIIMGSYSQSAAEVNFQWKPGRLAMDKLADETNAQWEIGVQTQSEVRVPGLNPKVRVEFDLKRIPGVYEKLNMRVLLLVVLAYCGCWVAPAQALTLSVIAVLVVSGTLAQVDSRLPPLSYSVWIVDYQGGCLTFNIVLFMVYSVLNFGIVQDGKLTRANNDIRDAAVARVKLISNAVQLVKDAAPEAPLAYAPHEQGTTNSWTSVRAALQGPRRTGGGLYGTDFPVSGTVLREPSYGNGTPAPASSSTSPPRPGHLPPLSMLAEKAGVVLSPRPAIPVRDMRPAADSGNGNGQGQVQPDSGSASPLGVDGLGSPTQPLVKHSTASSVGGIGRVLSRAFAEHDQDDSGMLDEAEFEILMAKLDAHTNPGEFAKIDTDHSGSIELSEFVAYFETRDETALQSPGRLLKTLALLKNVDVWTRYAFPVVFTAYVVAMHVGWGSYALEDAA